MTNKCNGKEAARYFVVSGGGEEMSKKLKIVSAVAAVVVLVLTACIVYIFSEQWNFNGYSKYFSISIDQAAPLEKIYADENCEVYTYHLTECGCIQFWSGKTVPLEQLLNEKKIRLSTVLEQMDQEVEADQIVYQHENYKIVNQGNAYIVCDAQADVDLVRNKLKMYDEK